MVWCETEKSLKIIYIPTTIITIITLYYCTTDVLQKPMHLQLTGFIPYIDQWMYCYSKHFFLTACIYKQMLAI